MPFGYKLLLGWLLAFWLVPTGLAWQHRRESPLWAWTRIASAILVFSGFELWLWFPTTSYPRYVLYVGVAIYGSKFFMKRRLSPQESAELKERLTTEGERAEELEGKDSYDQGHRRKDLGAP